MATPEAQVSHGGQQISWNASAAYSSGEVIETPAGCAGVVAGLKDVASGDEVAAYISGQFKFASASGTTFSAGQAVYWDASANQAVATPAGAVDDIYLGTAVVAKTSGQTVVETELNGGFAGAGHLGPRSVFSSRAALVAHDDGTTEFDLIPAAQNANGVVIVALFAEVTEQPAGSSEDQMVVTLFDGDDNAIATLTTTDTSPDAVGDVIMGSLGVVSASTGDVLPVIPAGKRAYVEVTQATAGTPAGELKVRVLAVPLL